MKILRWIKLIFYTGCLHDIREEIRLGYNDKTNLKVERYFRFKVYLIAKTLL